MNRVTLLLGLLATAMARAQYPPPLQILHAGAGSTLTIRGSTTIGARWHCTASNVDARLAIVSPVAADSTIPDVRGVALHVPVSVLRCQSSAMERAMRQALKVDQDTSARTITARFEINDSIPAASRAHPLLVGGLRVAGTERNVILRAAVTRHEDGTVLVRSIVPLQLSQFGIAPPRVLLGTVRARDAVSVEIELHYLPPDASRAASGGGTSARKASPASSAVRSATRSPRCHRCAGCVTSTSSPR